jgi:serine/threonine-protein kinase
VLALDDRGAYVPAGIYRLFARVRSASFHASGGDRLALVSVDDPGSRWPELPPRIIALFGLAADDIAALQRFYAALAMPPTTPDEHSRWEQVVGTSLPAGFDTASLFVEDRDHPRTALAMYPAASEPQVLRASVRERSRGPILDAGPELPALALVSGGSPTDIDMDALEWEEDTKQARWSSTPGPEAGAPPVEFDLEDADWEEVTAVPAKPAVVVGLAQAQAARNKEVDVAAIAPRESMPDREARDSSADLDLDPPDREDWEEVTAVGPPVSTPDMDSGDVAVSIDMATRDLMTRPAVLSIATDPAVRITISDAMGNPPTTAEGPVTVWLRPGLYRMRLERGTAVSEQLLDHRGGARLDDAGPPLVTPAPITGAASSRDYYATCARAFSSPALETCPPLGTSPFEARLLVFIRRLDRHGGPPTIPSEPISLHDLSGRRLATLDATTAHVDDDLGFLALNARVAAGTYRLRAVRSRRDLAVTVPPGRAAHVIVADRGRLAMQDARVSLVPINEPYDPDSPLHRAMECAIGELRLPGRRLPRMLRELPVNMLEADLCLGLAILHLARRARDLDSFSRAWERLQGYSALPDVAILDPRRFDHPRIDLSYERLPEIADHRALIRYAITARGIVASRSGPATPPVAVRDRPPLFHASFTRRCDEELEGIDARGALAQAICAPYHDSIWCTWSAHPWDARWVEPTIEALRQRGPDDEAPAIARRARLPVSIVQRTIHQLDRTLPIVDGALVQARNVQVPGYTLGGALGRGGHGRVFQAARDRDGAKVAIKVVPLFGGDLRRIFRERMLAVTRRLQHPRVLPYSALGTLEHEHSLWLEMPLCRGSVADSMAELDEPLPVARACQIALDALQGLDYLHGRHAPHGGIKPGNLLYDLDGQIVIADLGLAHSLIDYPSLPIDLIDSSMVRFSPVEVLAGVRGAVAASDVWSMAATLYLLLTLEPPRERFADQSEIDAALDNPPVPIRERRPDLPAPVARCIDRALAPAIGDRPRDAAALRGELLAALS